MPRVGTVAMARASNTVRAAQRQRLRRAMLALALWSLAAPTWADARGLPEPLAPFEARYEVSNGTMTVGTATFSLARDSGMWRYRTDLEARGLFSMFVDEPMRETTWLRPHEGGLRPLIYRHREGDELRRVVFDWTAGRARVHEDGETRAIELEPGSQDQLSAILSVMIALAGGQRSVAFPGITDDGDAEALRFEARGEEAVDVTSGSYETVRVERRHDDDRVTITWLAPALRWLPVRVEQREAGDLIARLELAQLDRSDPE